MESTTDPNNVPLPTTAGRELDALVAEKVMECRVKRFVNGAGYDDACCTCKFGAHNIQDGPGCGFLKDYSCDIAAAWEVVETLRAGGVYSLTLHTEDNGWRFLINCTRKHPCGHETWNTVDGVADTAPLAICLAALKAVGVEG